MHCTYCNHSSVDTLNEQLLRTSWQCYCYCTALILLAVCATLQYDLAVVSLCYLILRSSHHLVAVGSDSLLLTDTTKCTIVCRCC
jgi:hypothetical protein